MTLNKLIERFTEQFDSPSWLLTARAVCSRHGIDGPLLRAASSDHVVFRAGADLIVKIYRPDRNCFVRELRAIRFAGGKTSIEIPELIAEGRIEGLDYAVLTQIGGRSMTRAEWLTVPKREQIDFIVELAAGIRELHGIAADEFEFDWDAFVEDRAATFLERQAAHGVNAGVVAALPKFLDESLPLIPRRCINTFMHADIHFGNLKISPNGPPQIAGLFDFADSRCGFHEYDFLAVGVLMIQGQGDLQREFFRAYGYSDSALDEELRRRLMTLTMLYETADLRRYALRLSPEAVDWPLEKLERSIWSFC
jgi:aminoglycoside phosphotransferase (APT) family kinase protein